MSPPPPFFFFLAVILLLDNDFLFLKDTDLRNGALCPICVPVHIIKKKKKKKKKTGYHFTPPVPHTCTVPSCTRGRWHETCAPMSLKRTTANC